MNTSQNVAARSPAETAALVASALLAVALFGLAAWLCVAAVQMDADPEAPHGGGYQWLGAVVLGGLGALFGTAALAFWRRWRVRWAALGLAVLVPASALAVALLG